MEQKIISWLKSAFPRRFPAEIGIGDDAAVLFANEDQWVVTTDAVVDGVHFQRDRHSWRRIGRKAIAVNLSDLAAMGAKPQAIVVCLVLPLGTVMENVQELYAGISEHAAKYNVAIVGGDTNFSDGPLMINITAMGTIAADRNPWKLSGAQLGDAILVSGSLGGSILGRHLDFEPRGDLVAVIAELFDIHAATDISDGFVFNLNAILSASNRGATIDLDKIPMSDAAHDMSDDRPPINHALYDGEDFELILVVDQNTADELLKLTDLPCPLTKIGTIVSGSGVHGLQSDGTKVELPVHGFIHGQGLPSP